ncbi:hypothetical protein JCM8202_000415 [Rhodotorula sphaerocarpa]
MSSSSASAPATAPTKSTKSKSGSSGKSRSRWRQTETGNLVSTSCTVLGGGNIVLGGKSILHPGVVLRGDLRRAGAAAAASGTAGGGGKEPGVITIVMGKYCHVEENAVLRPGYKTYKGAFSYYPMKIGDLVTIGAGSVVEAAQIGTGVEIGKNCIIGSFAILKDFCKIADGAVVGPGTVVPSLTEWAGSPARPIGHLPESTPEAVESKVKALFLNFQPD